MTDLPEISSPQAPDSPLPPPRPVPIFQRIGPVSFALVSLCIVFFLYQFVAGAITLIVSGTKVTLENVGLVRWSTLIGQILFILLPTVVLVRLRGRRPVEFFRLRLPGAGQVALVIIGTFALQQMLQGYLTVQDMIPLPTELQKVLDMIKKLFEEAYRVLVVAQTPGELIVVLVIVALVPAIAEELLFRGLVQRSLEEAAGGLRGALITGVIFGAYHLIPTNVVPLAVLGMYLGYVVYRSQSIVLSMSAHFFNNLVACLAVYLHVDEDFLAIAPGGKTSGALMALNFLFFTVVFLAATLYFRKMTQRRQVAGFSSQHGVLP